MLPFVIGALVASKAIGAAVNYVGQRKGARAVEREGEMERELFGRSADILEEQAQDALARGREAELRQRAKMRMLTGEQRASYAAQGVELDIGSARDVVASDRQVGEMDLFMIRENAAREALGFTRQAGLQRERGQLAYTANRNRAKQMRWDSVGTLANFTGDMLQLYASGGFSKGGKG